MSTPRIVTIIDKFGNETDLEAQTNYNHDKLVGLYQEESEQYDGCPISTEGLTLHTACSCGAQPG